MKVYLVRKFYFFGQPKFIIYFYAKCGDLKHVNLDLIKNNEDIDNYFKSYYGELNDILFRLQYHLFPLLIKDLGNLLDSRNHIM